MELRDEPIQLLRMVESSSDHDPDEISGAFKKHCSKCDTWNQVLFIACQQMEIGTKPIPISVLTAVTNSALNAASVFPSRRLEISESHTDSVGRHFNIQVIDAVLRDF